MTWPRRTVSTLRSRRSSCAAPAKPKVCGWTGQTQRARSSTRPWPLSIVRAAGGKRTRQQLLGFGQSVRLIGFEAQQVIGAVALRQLAGIGLGGVRRVG